MDHSHSDNSSTPSVSGRGRSVLLLVTGGIAAYKSCTLVRRLVDAGISVRVAMTEAATRFVSPMTFEALSGQSVGTTLWGEGGESPLDHIQWVREAELVVVAPATADFLAKMRMGLAGDLPSTLVTAADVPILVAPAMNDRMWQNPANQENLRILMGRGVEIIEPGTGFLACGTVAEGRLAEPEEIVERVLAALAPGSLEGRRVVITAGGSREAIDTVRFIGNRSSGRMGIALAAAARQRGADVHLHLGPTEVSPPSGIQLSRFESTADLQALLAKTAPEAEVIIMAAAVSDMQPVAASATKIKKSDIGGALALARTPDLLAELGEHKKPGQLLVGFALETGGDAVVESESSRKLEEKHLDLICGNRADEPGEGFETATNRLYLLDADGRGEWTANGPKSVLAHEVLARIASRLADAELSPETSHRVQEEEQQ